MHPSPMDPVGIFTWKIIHPQIPENSEVDKIHHGSLFDLRGSSSSLLWTTRLVEGISGIVILGPLFANEHGTTAILLPATCTRKTQRNQNIGCFTAWNALFHHFFPGFQLTTTYPFKWRAATFKSATLLIFDMDTCPVLPLGKLTVTSKSSSNVTTWCARTNERTWPLSSSKSSSAPASFSDWFPRAVSHRNRNKQRKSHQEKNHPCH